MSCYITIYVAAEFSIVKHSASCNMYNFRLYDAQVGVPDLDVVVFGLPGSQRLQNPVIKECTLEPL